MSNLQEIRDALEGAAHNSDDTNEMAYYYNIISTLDALMETHVLVAKEPTVEMLLAAMTVWEVHNSEFDMDRLEKKYKAMIAAAQEQK